MLELRWETIEDPQRKALASLKEFANLGVLGGGTALALQLGHRKSIDLDFFVKKSISLHLVAKIQKYYAHIDTMIRTGDEFTFVSPHNVKITFLFYPYRALYKPIPTASVSFFDWRDIALDKAHTIGRRHEWRDYVDLYYCAKNRFSLQEIIEGSGKKFGDSFSSKLFLSQLVYMDDIEDFSSVECIGEVPAPDEVKRFFEQEIGELKMF